MKATDLTPEMISAIKVDIAKRPTLERQNKSEVLTVEINMLNGVMEARIIQSSYVPRNFLCDKCVRMTVSEILSL